MYSVLFVFMALKVLKKNTGGFSTAGYAISFAIIFVIMERSLISIYTTLIVASLLSVIASRYFRSKESLSDIFDSNEYDSIAYICFLTLMLVESLLVSIEVL